MTTLRFEGDDYRNLIDTLIDAVEVAAREGERPSIEVNGRTYGELHLVNVAMLLPYAEPLQERHQSLVDGLFGWQQFGYGRTAANLALRANHIAAATRIRRAASAAFREWRSEKPKSVSLGEGQHA